MAYRRRCHCTTGDIPHHSPEIAHKRIHSRCTRTVTLEIRRLRDTSGRRHKGPWYGYCRPCGDAIRAFQGPGIVEVREAAEVKLRGSQHPDPDVDRKDDSAE